MTISNGINGHANGHTNGHTNGNETTSKNGVLFAKPQKASISSVVSELFEDNITAKILHAAESGLVNNVSTPQFDMYLTYTGRTLRWHTPSMFPRLGQMLENTYSVRSSSGPVASSQVPYTR